MTRVALKGLASRPVRTILTTLAIVLGVGMVSAAFTLTDTMRARGRLAVLRRLRRHGRGRRPPSTAFAVDSKRLRDPAAQHRRGDARPRSARVPQVETAVGDISDQAKIIGDDGKPVGDGPYFGDRASTRPRPGAAKLTAFRLQSRPLGDRAGRGRHRRRHGGEAALRGRRPRPHRHARRRPRTFRVVGVARFGNVKSLGTATTAVFDLADRAAAVPQAGPLRLDPRRRKRRHVGRRTSARRSPPSSATAPGADRGRPRPLHARRPEDVHRDHQGRPARVRRRGDPRGRVHDLQHALDHRRPAHARVRDAAHGRRRAPPGARLGDGRGARPRARRVDHRPRRGLRPGRRPQRAVRSARPLAAPGGHGVRGAHGDRGGVGRHAGDAGGRHAAGAAGDEDRSRQRAARRRSVGSQAAAPVARGARRGVAAGPPGGRARRLGRQARAPQRDAPPGPHGRSPRAR